MLQNKKISGIFFLFNFLILFTFNFSVFSDLVDEWLSAGPYNHGLLGFGLALYVFWTKREMLHSIQFSFLGLCLLSLVSTLFLVANLASIGQLQVLSLFLITVALLVSVYGFTIIRTLFLPLTILLLTLPVWNILQIPLREISTWVSFYGVKMLGFDIAKSGYHLITSGGTFIVEEACSGLGFFLASALYAVFVAEVNNLSRKDAANFLLLSVLIAIVANWIRITIIVMVGSQTAMQHFIVQDHLTFGWFVFAACFVPLIVIGNLYFPRQPPLHIKSKPLTKEQKTSLRAPISASVIILIFALSTLFISSRFDDKYKLIVSNIPPYTQINANKTSSHDWFPISRGVSNEEFSYFSQDKDLFQVYLANYAKQSQGNEMIFVENSLFDKSRWYNAGQDPLVLPPSSPLKKINLLTLQKNEHRSRLIAYWYLINGHYVSDKKMAKWYEIKAALKGEPGATLIAIAFDFSNKEKQAAIKTISNFAQAFIDQPINVQGSL